MIESGFLTWALANPVLQALLGQSPQEAALHRYSAFDFSFLRERPPLPAIVLDRVKSMEASDALDARTAASTMLEGRFQFGSVAEDSATNPANFSGYLSACLLSAALRQQLLGLATGNSTLPDGTAIDDLLIVDEFDAHYEVAGKELSFTAAQGRWERCCSRNRTPAPWDRPSITRFIGDWQAPTPALSSTRRASACRCDRRHHFRRFA